MSRSPLWFALLAACAPDDGRAPITFDVELAARDCPAVDLSLPLARVWLQEAAELAWAWPSPVATAWAHPGHDPAGTLIGESLGPWTVDPCRGGPLGPGAGYQGTVATAMLILQGEASLVGRVDEVDLDLRLPLDHPVAGIPFVAPLDEGERITLAFDPTLTVSVLPQDTDGDGVLTIEDDGAAAAFTYGLTNPNSWTLGAP